MSRRPLLVLAIGATLIAACGADPAPSVPAGTYPGLRAGGLLRLEVETLADDAVEPAALRTLLDEAGFTVAVERTFVGSAAVRSVTARIVQFSSADGAARYLGWLRSHAADLLGESERAQGIELPGGTEAVSFTAAPRGCCAKAMTTSLAAWQRGSKVFTVLAVGPAADEAGVADLARAFDGSAAAAERP